MKKTKKPLSLLLAFALVFTMTAAVFSASAAEENAYAPSYTENVTKEDMEGLVTDLDTIIGASVLTGAVVESIYKFLPSLKSVVMLNGSSELASDKGAFYQTSYPERFADFPDGLILPDVTDENGAVTEGTFTAFFREHPIVCDTPAQFMEEIDKIIDLIIIDNLVQTIVVAFLFGGDTQAAQAFTSGLDDLCAALGIEQEQKAIEAMGLDDYECVPAELQTYVKNILHAVLPDPIDSIFNILRRIAADENAALLYSGISGLLGGLNGVVTSLSGLLTGLGVDISAITDAITSIKTLFESLPTIDMGENQKRIDLEGSLSYLADSLSDGMLAVQFGDDAVSGDAVLMMRLEHMDFDRIANAETNGDALKIMYDYLYDNLLGIPENNAMVAVALGFLNLPEETVGKIQGLMALPSDDLLDYIVDTAAVAAGRQPQEDPVKPTDPTDPVVPTDPTEPDAPTQAPSTEPADPTQPENNTDTGDSAIAGIALLTVVAAGAFALTRKRKTSNNH